MVRPRKEPFKKQCKEPCKRLCILIARGVGLRSCYSVAYISNVVLYVRETNYDVKRVGTTKLRLWQHSLAAQPCSTASTGIETGVIHPKCSRLSPALFEQLYAIYMYLLLLRNVISGSRIMESKGWPFEASGALRRPQQHFQ